MKRVPSILYQTYIYVFLFAHVCEFACVAVCIVRNHACGCVCCVCVCERESGEREIEKEGEAQRTSLTR